MDLQIISVINPPRCPYCKTHRITTLPLKGGDTARRVVHRPACRTRWDIPARRYAEQEIDEQLAREGVHIASYNALPLQHRYLQGVGR